MKNDEKNLELINDISFGEEYEILEVLSNSGVPKCFLVMDNQGCEKQVIKIIENSRIWKGLIKNKAKILGINHPNIVKIINIKIINGYNCIVQKYINGSNLKQLMEEGVITLNEYLDIFKSILDALKYMQNNELSHKNINPSNIVYNSIKKTAILINIDYTALKSSENKNFLGTIKYSAPEKILQNSTLIQADMYSLGVVLSQFIIGEIPFCVDLKKRNNVILDILKKCTETGEDIKKDLYEKIEALLKYNPNERTDIDTMLQYVSDLKNRCSSEHWEDIILYSNNRDIFKREWDEIIETNFTDIEIENNQNKSYQKRKILYNKKEMKNYYWEKVMDEYDEVVSQAKSTFKIWKWSMVICLISASLILITILLEQYTIALAIGGFYLCIFVMQKLIEIKEDEYRVMLENKIKYLEKMGCSECILEDVEYVEEPIEQYVELQKKAIRLLKRIREENDN